MGIDLLEAKIPKGERVYAVGDLHGCLDELKQLLSLIKQDLKKNPIKKYHLVFLGDYFDRGPDSAGVLDKLIKLKKKHANVICIKGNHAGKFIEFLENPKQMAPGFFTYGGIETVQSYGITDGVDGSCTIGVKCAILQLSQTA